MALTPGSKLGPYEIVGAIGAGGMGEVYRAKDTRLDREVAVKILSGELAKDADLRARFEREARAISALNHPNICTLYDVGHQDGTDFLVMELLEGESLAERLHKGALPVEQVLSVGQQIADALEKAHRSGIIHRDLKPGNVVLTKSGAKLLDFGLAKPRAAAAASAMTGAITRTTPVSPITQQGTVVGTFQYMSPEQIEGGEADARSDIFALGAVLYEMATGKRAFEGKSQLSVASAILEKDPEPISKIQPLTPPALEHVVETCLAKDPEERFQTAHDVKLQLRWIAEGGSSAVGVPAVKSTHRRHRERLAWAVAAVCLLAAAVIGGLYLQQSLAPSYSVHSYVLPPEKATFVFSEDQSGPAVISPDGRRIAFVARASGERMLWIQPLNSSTAQPMSGTGGAYYPFWSADSRYVGFFANGKLKKIEANGGPPQALCDAENGRGGAWNEDGTIIFAGSTLSGLQRVGAGGGSPSPLTTLQGGETSNRWPVFLPDGKHFVYFSHGSVSAESAVYVASLDHPDQRKLMFRNESSASYAAPGYLMWVRDGTLLAQKFNPRSQELSGDAMPLVEHVAVNTSTWRGVFTASENGVLLYQGGAISGGSQLAWYDRSGKAGDLVLPDSALYMSPQLSPDGKRLAVTIENDKGNYDIWVVDLERKTKSRITFDEKGANRPVWSADGKSIFYAGDWITTRKIVRRAADGTGEPEKILESAAVSMAPFSVSADGRYLAFNRTDMNNSNTKTDVYAVPLAGDRKPFPIMATTFVEVLPMISPNGKWVAYMSDESGKYEVYIRPFPSGEGKWQVSNGGGAVPLWRRDGKELVYTTFDQQLMSVEVGESGAGIVLGVSTPLFKYNAVSGTDGPFTMTGDAQRFVINRVNAEGVAQPLTLVTNWTADLKK
jgi:serine/threonine protein kinase/Tol biopolymer transport system component